MPRKMFMLIGLVLIIALALSACAPAVTATTAPVQPTTKPADTQARSADGPGCRTRHHHLVAHLDRRGTQEPLAVDGR